MAVVSLRKCDVSGVTTEDVRPFNVTIERNDDGTVSEENLIVQSWLIDLSPRSLERLKKFISRGITAPTPRKE